MLAKEFIDELLDRLKLINTPENRVIALRKINLSYDEVANAYDWDYLIRTSELITVANYTAGTVSWTKDGYAVTGSGTVWDSSMEGRYINMTGSSNWYKIIKVSSATSLTTLQPIIEDNGSGVAYKIWKRFYYLPSVVRKVKDMSNWFRTGQMASTEERIIRDNYATFSDTGEPEVFDIIGEDPFERSYSDGTITINKDENVATGVSTLWLANAEEGDLLTVGSFEYRVKRVESDTSLRLYNYSTSTQTSVTYTLTKESPLGLQMMFQPQKQYLLPYNYVKRVYPLVNEDKDRPELPKEFDQAILDGAEASKLRDMDDQKWSLKMQEYEGRVKFLKSTKTELAQKRNSQFRPYIPTRKAY